LALEGGPGAAAGGIAGADEVGAGAGTRGTLGRLGDISREYAPQLKKIGKAAQGMQMMGLLNQPAPVALPTPPGGGAQAPGMPTSTQISEQSFAPQNPQPLSYEEMLRRRLMMG
jgi:hypothetical protein